MLLGNARCVNPRVADEVGAPDLVNRIVNLLPLSKKDVVEDELADGWVRLRLGIDSGSGQLF